MYFFQAVPFIVETGVEQDFSAPNHVEAPLAQPVESAVLGINGTEIANLSVEIPNPAAGLPLPEVRTFDIFCYPLSDRLF